MDILEDLLEDEFVMQKPDNQAIENKDKIANIKQMLQNGTYQINCVKIAEKLLSLKLL